MERYKMKALNIILLLSICTIPIISMEKLPKETIEIVEKHLSLKDFTKEDIKRLSQELAKAQEEEELEVTKNGCKCNKNIVKDVVLGIGTTIASVGSITVSIISLFLKK